MSLRRDICALLSAADARPGGEQEWKAAAASIRKLMVTGLRLDHLQLSGNAGQRSAALLSWYALPALPPASGLAAKTPTLILSPDLGHVLCELPLLTQDNVNEQRNWPPAGPKSKAEPVC